MKLKFNFEKLSKKKQAKEVESWDPILSCPVLPKVESSNRQQCKEEANDKKFKRILMTMAMVQSPAFGIHNLLHQVLHQEAEKASETQ